MKTIFTKEKQIIRINRRELLTLGATGAFALAGFHSRGGSAVFGLEHNAAADTTTYTSTPALEEGPYFVEERLNRSDVRSDLSTGVLQLGMPLFLSITISQLATDGTITPLPNAFVDIWCADAYGIYSDESSENSVGTTYLRGYQISDTNYPGWYSGRTVHVHTRVRIYPDNDYTQTATYDYFSQVFFDDEETDKVYASLAPYNTRNDRDTTNANDRVFTGAALDGTVSTEAGDYCLLRLAEDLSHATATFHMILDLANTYDESASSSTTTTSGSTGTTTGGTPPSTGGGTPPSTSGAPGG